MALRHLAILLLLAGHGSSGAATPAQPAPQAGVAALPASLPLRRDPGGVAAQVDWAPALALLAVAGAGGLWGLRHRRVRTRISTGGGPRAQNVVRLSSQALTAHASVHAVQWNGEELLLGCTAQQVTLLSRRPVASIGEQRP